MTKAELVEEVARAAELNKRDAEVIVETVFDSIIGALHGGEKVELRGFGSFRTRDRGPRRGRNPKTGEPVDVPAKRVPYFKPGKELKEFFTDTPEEGEGGEAGGEASAEAAAPEPAPAPSAATSEPAGEPPVEEHSVQEAVHEEHAAEPAGSSSEAAGGGSHPTGSSHTGSGD